MVLISIHAPLTGSDGAFLRCLLPRGISIHAPLTGSDPAQCPGDSIQHDFNPRSPYGERLSPCFFCPIARKFQSTLPLRGATRLDSNTAILQGISIHAPLTGSDA